MKLIRKLGTRINKSGNLISWGIFKCICNKEVERQLSNGYRAKSCGCIHYKLISIANTGKKRTEEQRQKISKGNTGKKRTEGAKLNYSKAKKGFKHSEESRRKNSESKKGRIPWNKGLTSLEDNRILSGKENPNYGNGDKIRGEKNPMYGVHRFGEGSSNWNNGSSFEEYGIEFNKKLKQQILERDNYTCQDPNCDGNHKKLHIHHIDYDKKNNNPENLITLCNSCHSKTNGKNNRNYWVSYYQILKERG